MAAADPGELESIMKTYDRLQQEFKDKGGYQYEADVRSVLHGLGFSHLTILHRFKASAEARKQDWL